MKNLLFVSALLFVVGCGKDLLPNGEACSENSSCESGVCLTEYKDGTVVDGGVCTQECEWYEDKTDSCPEGFACLKYVWTGEYNCYPDCESDADCRVDEGWSCVFLGLSSACVPPI